MKVRGHVEEKAYFEGKYLNSSYKYRQRRCELDLCGSG
jgi:hypothetical protein